MATKNSPIFRFQPFSKKQRQVLNWWTTESPVKDADGIIADGAIRSGKTISMSLAFVLWAMTTFNHETLAMCGKTVGSFRRNVVIWLKMMLTGRGYQIQDRRSENLLIVRRGVKENMFYIFGGKDERSQDLIQGMTLAGVFLDEVALMPESFVNQATGRCSLPESKVWFNCNPEFPSHWFKTKWIDQAADKNLLYLHFTMDDNLSLSERVKERYRRMYSGIWYDRFILGLWVLAEGLIYPMYRDAIADPPETTPEQDAAAEYVVSMDYGTQNAFAALLWRKYGTVWWAIREYYYSGRETGVQKTDEEYARDLDKWLADIQPQQAIRVIIDPSAASFIALLRQRMVPGGTGHRYKVQAAENAVVDGIRETATCMQQGYIKFATTLTNWRHEVDGYVWDSNDREDKPVKERDHAQDAARYFVKTMHIVRKNNRPERQSLWN